ncbi:nonstructural protein [Protoparvovirus eulipotyphla1]|uniref:Initiator protein NS1 n=5 Tax=Protoparvovirus TaxID=1506574 RepID=A0A0E3VL15_9VIRU|nr:nonstructural protein [Protoparvovirus eulipotyphla1]BAR42271.1 nonstructural protein [Protoparvovirus eulipotyphla1]
MALAENIRTAIKWLEEQKTKSALSFVFKIHDTHFIPERGAIPIQVTWKDYRIPSKHQETNDVYRLDNEALQRRDPEDSTSFAVSEEPWLHALVLTSLVKKSMFDYFKQKALTPEDVSWFIQSEVGKDSGLHIHLLLQSDKINTSSGKWICKFLAEKWSLYLCESVDLRKDHYQPFFNQTKYRHNIENNEWVQILKYTHQTTRKDYVKPVNFGSMIFNYFLTKEIIKHKDDLGYIYSSDGAFLFDDMNMTTRHRIAKIMQEKDGQLERTEIQEITPQDKKKKRIETAKEITIKETIQTLSTKKLHTQEKWMLGEPDSYIQQIANPGGEAIIKATLDIVTLKMAVEHTALTLIIQHEFEKNPKIKKTKVWNLLKNNSMNPYKVFHAMMCCLNKQMGKRNTILLCGPASTGKSLIAQKIAQLVGNVGCYNPSNVNFPFNDCSNKNLIWIEEAGNFGTQVNQFKAIMSGQAIRLDQKGKGSKTIEPTPVIMTTNEDITRVVVGSELRPEHKQPIMDRCIRVHLTTRLPGDFGLLDDEEIPTIFKKLDKRGFKPTLASYCQKWGNPPTWSENWNTNLQKDHDSDEENKNPMQPKKPLVEVLDPKGEDAQFADLLQNIENEWLEEKRLMEMDLSQDLMADVNAST